METYYGQETQDVFRQIQSNLGSGQDGPDPKKKEKPKSKESGTEAAKKVLDGNWFLRLFAGREVMNAGRALDSYDEEGWKGYLNTSVANAHREIGFDFGNGQYINPWASTKMAPIPMTKVGRWMSKTEYKLMKETEKVIEGAGGKTSVATGGPNAFPSAASGSVYVEFTVPTSSLVPGGKSNWFSILGNDASRSQLFMLQKQGGESIACRNKHLFNSKS